VPHEHLTKVLQKGSAGCYLRLWFAINFACGQGKYRQAFVYYPLPKSGQQRLGTDTAAMNPIAIVYSPAANAVRYLQAVSLSKIELFLLIFERLN